jgi:uncharacterized membrane protein YcaP (DUF421 family)
LELLVRSLVIYASLVVFMRNVLRRASGRLAMMDVVFGFLIAKAAGNALGNHTSVGDAVVLTGTLMGWNYLFNLLSFHVPLVERLVSAPPLQVVRDGRLILRNMHRELLTEDELMDNLRRQGVDRLQDVKAAYIQAGGRITVIRQE